jgi:hypothetical protein
MNTKAITSAKRADDTERKDYVFIFRPSAFAPESGQWVSQNFFIITNAYHLEARELAGKMCRGFESFNCYERRPGLVDDLIADGYSQLTTDQVRELGGVRVLK